MAENATKQERGDQARGGGAGGVSARLTSASTTMVRDGRAKTGASTRMTAGTTPAKTARPRSAWAWPAHAQRMLSLAGAAALACVEAPV